MKETHVSQKQIFWLRKVDLIHRELLTKTSDYNKIFALSNRHRAKQIVPVFLLDIIISPIKYTKSCHTGLDPASNLLMDSGLRRNDGNSIVFYWSNNITLAIRIIANRVFYVSEDSISTGDGQGNIEPPGLYCFSNPGSILVEVKNSGNGDLQRLRAKLLSGDKQVSTRRLIGQQVLFLPWDLQ